MTRTTYGDNNEKVGITLPMVQGRQTDNSVELSSLNLVLTVITNYDKKSTKQTKKELYHILSSLIIVSGCN